MAALKVNSKTWTVRVNDTRRGSLRRDSSVGFSFPPEFLTDRSSVAIQFTAESAPEKRRGLATNEPIDVSFDVGPEESAVLAIRYPSGAISFHPPIEQIRRGTGRASQVRFVVHPRSTVGDAGKRSVVTKVLKAVIVKVAKVAADKLASWALPKLVAALEKHSWHKHGLEEGWCRISKADLQRGVLERATPDSTERSLVLIHGTFSNAAASFKELAKSSFFEEVSSLYGNRIFAFNHFSLSRTPEENARQLLAGLPIKQFTMDAITHSRGGLVLRNLVENTSIAKLSSSKLQLGHAVLVACPNAGTPLASPRRWKDTVGWLANLLELFPDNPFTIGAEFVANALTWLASHVAGDIPGLHAMDEDGDPIHQLQSGPAPSPESYSALVSNYQPEDSLWHRLIDAGVDQFFGSANDLVVPSEGGWRVDYPASQSIPAGRVGCFGPGGNLAPVRVTHVNFFAQPETMNFLVTALNGKPQPLNSIQLGQDLPSRRLLRGAAFASTAPVESATVPTLRSVTPIAAPHDVSLRAVSGAIISASDTFHLLVLPRTAGQQTSTGKDHGQAQILAQYGSARILEDFYLAGATTSAGQRWRQIIDTHKRIKNYVDNNQGAMPDPAELRNFGKVLFETMIPGTVRRLYDTARSLQGSKRLDVIFTSTIPWVADKPWEFAFDPVRMTSLATEDLHFARNVMTAVPAEVINDQKKLSILVVAALPVGLGNLSLDEEIAVIRRGFEPLIEADIAEVDVLARATPASMHGHISTKQYAVVHFIGHGRFDRDTDKGYLVFQDDQGNPYEVDDRSVREILCGRGIRLVFLNACETGRGGGHADFNSGVAPALVAGGVPIVVANQYKVLDTSATFFAQHFYWSLAHGLSVGEAAREARIAVNYSLSGESIDWAVPVMYARDPNSRLSPLQDIDLGALPSPAVRSAVRRRMTAHRLRVAVWDVQSQFPQLAGTVEQMNRVQDYYGFEIVDLSVPMDAWWLYKYTRYLDAERFADRLAPQIAQLGVHYISAIVNERMVCGVAEKKPIVDIYAWWPPSDKPPVMVFSTNGLAFMPTGQDTNRGIANLEVGGIAGYLLSRDSHKQPPKTCPRYYNPRRDFSLIVGAQHFCKECTKRLKTHTSEAKALNAILGTFDHEVVSPARKKK